MADTLAQERYRRKLRERQLEPSTALELRKREYEVKPYFEPVVKEAVKATFEAEMKAEEAEIKKQWREAVATEESKAKAEFEEQLQQAKTEIPSEVEPEIVKSWEAEQKAVFQQAVSEWKSQQEPVYQEYIQQWRSQWRPRSLAERMMEWKTEPLPLVTTTGIKYEPVYPLAEPAGIVASVESFVYGAGRLVGVKTPRMPPTLSGALISEGVSTVITGKGSGELERLKKEYPREYIRGTLIGDVILGIALGKGAEKLIIKPLSPVVSKGWKGLKTKLGLIRKPPSPYKGLEIPSWMSKEDWYRFYTQTARATSRPVITHGVTKPKPWRVIQKVFPTPKGGGLLLQEFKTKPELAKVALHGISKKTALASYLMKTPTRMYPVPLPYVVGASFILGAKVAPKVKAIQKPSLLEKTIVKPKAPQISVLQQPLEQEVAVAQVTAQQLATTQVAQQIFGTPTPTPTKHWPPKPPRRPTKRRLKRKKKRKKAKKPKFGRYETLYPVATESQVARYLLGRRK